MKILLYANTSQKARDVASWARRLVSVLAGEVVIHLPAEPDAGERAAIEILQAELVASGGALPPAMVQAEAGSTEEGIAAEVARGDYPLVLLAPAGRRGVVRLIHGSLIGQVVRRVRSSVLIVRDGGVPPRSILACLSGSRHSLTNVRAAALLSAAFNANVTLLMVISQLPVEFTGRQDSSMTHDFLKSDHPLAVHMRTANELLLKMGGRGSVRVREGLVIEEILDEMETSGHDLLMIGTHRAEDYDPMYEDLTSELVTRVERSTLVVGPRAEFA